MRKIDKRGPQISHRNSISNVKPMLRMIPPNNASRKNFSDLLIVIPPHPWVFE